MGIAKIGLRWALAAWLVGIVPAAWADAVEDGLAAYARGQFDKAFALLKPLADAGNPLAQNQVGLMYAKGQGAKRDDAAAVQWFRKSAQQDNDKAKANLAFMIANGRARETPEDDLPDCR